ncbi:RIP metalloprotease RseP [Curvibacter sp. APW13]|uniref:RIP metalloprotease RseP n=1 Tax=Curvibacter sp. APW13 TaxID=3077236 RepID=UPI0028DD6D88|nr:RIP metalloprotease RseP [Curvibacter sp. APW13]MDT8992082.1 RIP metalloprotease RseP [Curvibacter sp. APW13]
MTILAFLLAVGFLVAVHEWGHYRMALACGIKVMRLSIGFGPVVWSYTSPRTGIQYALGLLPLGGYVRMLDEREAPVPAELLPLAFNRQALHKRAAVVAAGPLANLVLAVLLYAGVGLYGIEQAAPVLSEPPAGSLAAKAGIHAGDRVVAVSRGEQPMAPIASFEDMRWVLTQAALSGDDIVLHGASANTQWKLPMSSMPVSEFNAETFSRIGIMAPFAQPVIADISAGDIAERSGLLPGDLVLSVDGVVVQDAASLRQRIRASGFQGSAELQVWRVQRAGREMAITVRPRVLTQDRVSIGRIGAAIGGPVEKVVVHYGLTESLMHGLGRTGEIASLTLGVLGRMVVGEASLRNISGPISVADYAGKSAASGWVHYLLFLAMVSISLGVLNLLPIPMLDGGHLMYYLWEWLSGAPPSEQWLEGLQRAGVAVLAALMGIAVWNDVARLLL